MPKPISKEELDNAIENNIGYCTYCQKFTNSCVEPDASKYKCEECGLYTVYGAEEAILWGFIP